MNSSPLLLSGSPAYPTPTTSQPFGAQFLGFLAYLLAAGLLGYLEGNDFQQSMDAATQHWLPTVMSMAVLWVGLTAAHHRNFDSLVECVRDSQESYEVAADALELGQPQRP